MIRLKAIQSGMTAATVWSLTMFFLWTGTSIPALDVAFWSAVASLMAFCLTWIFFEEFVEQNLVKKEKEVVVVVEKPQPKEVEIWYESDAVPNLIEGKEKAI